MLDTEDLLATYDAQLRPAETTNLPPGAHAEADGAIVRVVGLRRGGFVVGGPDLGVTGPELDALIARQRDFFAARGEELEWKTWSHDRPAELPQRLLSAGFAADPTETVLVGEADRLTESPAELEGVTVREVTEDADLRGVADLATEVWGGDRSWQAAQLAGQLAAGDDTVVVVAEAGGRIVSSSRLEFVPGTDFAGLWGGATLAEWRGKGLYRALVAHRARIAVARGTRYLQVDATDDSRPILERLGFAALTKTTPYLWSPARS